MGVTYVLAACAAARHHEWAAQSVDRTLYVRRHLELLRPFADRYERVVLANSGADEQLARAARAILPDVAILDRANAGMSYGAFRDAMGQFRSTYYVLMEDDYVLTRGPEELVAYMECSPRCSMYAGGVTDWHGVQTCVVFAGIVRREAAAHWLAQSMTSGADYMVDGVENQVRVSEWLQHEGFELHDWLDRWSSAFWASDGNYVRWFSREHGTGSHLPALSHQGNLAQQAALVPLQALDGTARVSDGREWRTGQLGADGVLHVAAP